MNSTESEHIRIRASGCVRSMDVNQIITDFALDSEDEDEPDENFDVQAEVAALYSAVQNIPVSTGLESSDSEDDESPESPTKTVEV